MDNRGKLGLIHAEPSGVFISFKSMQIEES